MEEEGEEEEEEEEEEAVQPARAPVIQGRDVGWGWAPAEGRSASARG